MSLSVSSEVEPAKKEITRNDQNVILYSIVLADPPAKPKRIAMARLILLLFKEALRGSEMLK